MKKAGVVIFLLLSFIAFAHEYVLLAANYRLKRGDTLELHLFVADGFNIEKERPYQITSTKKFELLTKDSAVNLYATPEGSLPIVNHKVNFDGGGLVHLQRNYARIEMPTQKFLAYLKEDHLEGIAPKVDMQKKLQKERYTRYIKTLVQSGDVYTDTLHKQITGHQLEIVLLQNPYTLKKGAQLPVQLLFEGKPLQNKVVTARYRKGNTAAQALTARTNNKGICSFAIQEGEWFIHLTHMIPCPDKEDSDWESFWAAYSFAIDYGVL